MVFVVGILRLLQMAFDRPTDRPNARPTKTRSKNANIQHRQHSDIAIRRGGGNGKCHAQYLCLLCLRQKTLLRCEPVEAIQHQTPTTNRHPDAQSIKIQDIRGNNKTANSIRKVQALRENGVWCVCVCVPVFEFRSTLEFVCVWVQAQPKEICSLFLCVWRKSNDLTVSHFSAAFYLAHTFASSMCFWSLSLVGGFVQNAIDSSGASAPATAPTQYPSGNVCHTKPKNHAHTQTRTRRQALHSSLSIYSIHCSCVCVLFPVCACIQLCSPERKRQHTHTHRQTGYFSRLDLSFFFHLSCSVFSSVRFCSPREKKKTRPPTNSCIQEIYFEQWRHRWQWRRCRRPPTIYPTADRHKENGKRA